MELAPALEVPWKPTNEISLEFFMNIQKFDKYLLIGTANRWLGYLARRSLYGKAALASIGMAALISSTSLTEFFITELVKPNLPIHAASANCAVFSPDLLKFILSLLFLCLSIYWVGMAYKDQKTRAAASELIFEKNTAKIVEIGPSRVHAFCGSITHISGIEIVVTSENTDLDLGSMTGTSVSGRIRDLAAKRSAMGEVATDNLGNFISAWKTSVQKFSNFSLGHCVICNETYEAAAKGIKTIIFAVAIKKNSDGTSIIDETAIHKIIGIAIDTAVSTGQPTLFIPVFGLGSGNTSQGSAIKMTTNAVKQKLSSTNSSIDVYVGVYRLSDLTELCMSLKRS
mgnify:CR=1 FL=1